MATSGSILGNPVRRTEDPRILRGDADYFDDLEVEGLLHVAFVRSTMAHASIESVDTSEAVTMPGVVAVYTADDLGLEPGQGFAMVPAALSRPPLARDVVRFVGDIVAVIVAETRAQAVDAAEMVIVDYDPLPTVIDPEAALADGAPLVFPEHGSNLASASRRCRWSPTASSSSSTATTGSPRTSPHRTRTACATRSREWWDCTRNGFGW